MAPGTAVAVGAPEGADVAVGRGVSVGRAVARGKGVAVGTGEGVGGGVGITVEHEIRNTTRNGISLVMDSDFQTRARRIISLITLLQRNTSLMFFE